MRWNEKRKEEDRIGEERRKEIKKRKKEWTLIHWNNRNENMKTRRFFYRKRFTKQIGRCTQFRKKFFCNRLWLAVFLVKKELNCVRIFGCINIVKNVRKKEEKKRFCVCETLRIFIIYGKRKSVFGGYRIIDLKMNYENNVIDRNVST